MKTITIKLDRERPMRFGIRNIEKLEELTGKNLDEINFNKLSVTLIAQAIYAGLHNLNEDIKSLDELKDLIDNCEDVTYEYLGDIIGEAFSNTKK